MKTGLVVAAAAVALLAGCGGSEESGTTDNSAEPTEAASGPARPAVFAMCLSCHTAERGKGPAIGPNLFGVAGAKSGARPGYNYSDALKNAGLVWTPENLAKFIENPQALVPGSKMIARGPRNPAARQEIADYLATLR